MGEIELPGQREERREYLRTLEGFRVRRVEQNRRMVIAAIIVGVFLLVVAMFGIAAYREGGWAIVRFVINVFFTSLPILLFVYPWIYRQRPLSR